MRREWFAVAVGAVVFMVAIFVAVSCKEEPARTPPAESDYAAARLQMVEGLRKDLFHPITDEKVLRAMRKVERHLFVEERLRPQAYEDKPLPIGEGQTISQPAVVGMMTQCAALQGGEKVLEVGTGSGYQAAVLAEIAAQVYTIEIVEPLGRKAEELLKGLGYNNIHVKIGDGFLGWPEEAPFDTVLITCAVPKFPSPLVEQLKEGGRILAPVGERLQMLRVGTKRGEAVEVKDVEWVQFVPMTGPGVEEIRREQKKGGE